MSVLNSREFDRRMLMATCSYGKLSKDHFTKVGFMLIKDGQTSPSIFSYNGLVSGSDDNCEIRTKTRPEKYKWGEHAERNGLYEAARFYLKDTVIFCAKFPNMDSARAIVITGISMMVTDFVEDLHSEYAKMCKEIFKTGKTILELDYSEDVKSYYRVLKLFQENNVKVYHPSRVLAEKGSFVGEGKVDETSRFLRKAVEHLDETIKYAELFSRREYKDAAMIVRKDTFKSVSLGSHNVPDGYDKYMTDEKEKETEFGRSFWYIEAVKDAIYNVLRPELKGSRSYVSLCSCMDCAMALYSVGVSKVITIKPLFESDVEKRWQEHFKRTSKFFDEVEMSVEYFSESELK